MQIKLLPSFKTDILQISNLELVITKSNSTKRINLSESHLINAVQYDLKSIEIHNNLFEDAVEFHYEVLYKNGIFKAFGFESKSDAVFIAGEIVPKTEPYIRINTKSVLSNTDGNKMQILNDIRKRVAETNTLPNITYGSKNLIYYTVYGDGYIQLLEKSLQSLKNTSTLNFDILLILDANTKNSVEQLPIINDFTVKYHIVPQPIDGIEASMNKTKVYDFVDIGQYKKILFLDCDILFLKDVMPLFDSINNIEKFYTICNAEVNSGSYHTHYHSLKFQSDELFELAVRQNNMPFNMGQYAFMNTSRMKEHFKNLNWFINIWPSSYFFEQSFGNVYFVYANNMDRSLSQYFCLTNASVSNLIKKHSNTHKAIHFIAPALNSTVKINFITRYLNAFQ